MLEPLILASTSEIRAKLLRDAGVGFEIVAPHLDEAALKEGLAAAGANPRDTADALAEAKAVKVARRRPGRLVLGADQVLVADGKFFDKPSDIDAARGQLRRLRGREHRLISALVLARDGGAIWRHIGIAKLTMRDFSDEFLEQYLSLAGEALTSSVGGYRLEAQGIQLFSAIDGDFFSILGLPLLPLLDTLRRHGMLGA